MQAFLVTFFAFCIRLIDMNQKTKKNTDWQKCLKTADKEKKCRTALNDFFFPGRKRAGEVDFPEQTCIRVCVVNYDKLTALNRNLLILTLLRWMRNSNKSSSTCRFCLCVTLETASSSSSQTVDFIRKENALLSGKKKTVTLLSSFRFRYMWFVPIPMLCFQAAILLPAILRATRC
jgi:hypothetical protein